jgi:hypothetical protein
VEPSLLEKSQGDLFRGEQRKSVFGIDVDEPFDARGILVLTYRYKVADGPRAQAKNDDTWVYVPTLRRVRRISTAQRTDAVSGTDFTFDDLRSFSGIVPQYDWTCLGTLDVLAPVNTKVKGYPHEQDHNFGPYGLSYADDRWELRHAVKIRMKPRNADHPYSAKDLYLDLQTYIPLYSFAYDQKQELWKIIWHNHRWSEDTSVSGPWYAGWEEIPKPLDVRVVSDTIVNVQTGTGNRIEFWDSHGTPYPSVGKVRRYVDIGGSRRVAESNAPRGPTTRRLWVRVRAPCAASRSSSARSSRPCTRMRRASRRFRSGRTASVRVPARRSRRRSSCRGSSRPR